MNILVSLDSNYINALEVMLTSLLVENPEQKFDVYVLNSSISFEEFKEIKYSLDANRCRIIDIKVDEDQFKDAPISDRYPKEMYYRILAAKLLPENIDRILYLDPDLIIINSIDELYNMDLEGKYFAGATHIGKQLNIINGMRLSMPAESEYINSGVLLMNIDLLRKEQDEKEVYNYIKGNSLMLFLPDQDVINALYGDKTVIIDAEKYNMGEVYYKKIKYLPGGSEEKIDMKWVVNNTCIIHYYGRNKPWKEDYWGELDVFYYIYEKKLNDYKNMMKAIKCSRE